MTPALGPKVVLAIMLFMALGAAVLTGVCFSQPHQGRSQPPVNQIK